MHQHVKILGWLTIVYSGLLLLLGAFLFVLISGAGALSGDRQAMWITGAIGAALAIFFFILSLPGIITGVGLLRFRPWARIVALILGALHLLSVPIGTALGVYTYWVLLNAQTVPLFADMRPAASTFA